jgi:ribosomal protein L11 methyltransferase
MNYIVYRLKAQADIAEILVAFLGEMPFDTFEESEEGVNAYIPEKEDSEDILQQLKDLQSRFAFEFIRAEIPHQNWNELWESNFESIQVGNFCGIRADFHPAFDQVTHELVINPKMAFGTGHHATTFMMIQLMEDMKWQDKKVFDYGTGTGILAILAAKLGANDIDAVDIEDLSYENTIENAQRNQVSGIEVYLGDLSVVTNQGYDIILANINRNVILESLSALYEKLKEGGEILFSGILAVDKALLLESAEKQGFTLQQSLQKGDWIALKMQKLAV